MAGLAFEPGCTTLPAVKLLPFTTSVLLALGFCAAGSLPAAEQSAPAAAESAKPGVRWQPWSDKIFEQAAAEKKLVLLDLGAGWCHWCHVMDETTYRDPAVVKLLNERFIAVHVDQDARPDLSNRYEEYGWPATIIFKWDGSELAKRRGYLPPKPMASMLQAFIDDPTPGPSIEAEPPLTAAPGATLAKEQRAAMRQVFREAYDHERAGWGDSHKYLNWNALEYCLLEGATGDAEFKKMAQQTLAASMKLIDPVWGGVYQYSTDGDWDHPHFEKIMPFQAENLRLLALASTYAPDSRWLAAAGKIRSYLQTFLTSPEGAFYVSQDADVIQGQHSAEYFTLNDQARRQQGMPRVDRHLYARENGLAITGLCSLYAATGDAKILADARRAAEWVLAHRALEGGGFRHDEKDAAGPYLADTLAMARAFLALYTVTAERPWLIRAQAAAGFIEAKFKGPIGYAASATSSSATLPPRPQMDENATLVRFALLLHHHTGEEKLRAMADHAMRYLGAPSVVESVGYGTSAILLADLEARTEPAHITIVGAKDDPAAARLFAIALRSAPAYTRLEWFDTKEGPLPRADVTFPPLKEAAAFLCANGACSSPLRNPEQLEERLKAFPRP